MNEIQSFSFGRSMNREYTKIIYLKKIFLRNYSLSRPKREFPVDSRKNVPEVLNAHMNKIYKKLTTIK